MNRPNQSQLPDDEIAICRRIREIREGLKWKMPDLAEKLGITRDRLASYEYCRAPLKFDIGQRLCREFNINHRWLAEGLSPRSPYLEVSAQIETRISARLLFSAAYYKYLKEPIWERLKEMAAMSECSIEELEHRYSDFEMLAFEPIGSTPFQTKLYFLHMFNRIDLTRLPPELWDKYSDFMEGQGKAFCDKHKAEIVRYFKKKEKALAQKQKPC